MKKIVLPILCIAMACGFVSCNNDHDKDSISEESVRLGIIGKWRYAIYDGQPVPTDEQMVATFHVDGSYEISFCNELVWAEKLPLTYNVIGNTVVMESKDYDLLSKEEIESVSKDRLKVSRYETTYDGIYTTDVPYEYVAVKKDFSQSIIGIWQGQDMQGQETYGNEKHYWEYCADGTYVYYEQDENGIWLPKDQIGKYVCDGDMLLSHWESSDSLFNECWILEVCNDSAMKWTALRKADDGSTFENTFSLKRVSGNDGNIMTGQYIKSKLQGNSWKSLSMNGNAVATNDREYYRFNSDGHGVYSTVGIYDWNVDSKFSYQVVNNGIAIEYLNTIQPGKTMQVSFIDDDSLSVFNNFAPNTMLDTTSLQPRQGTPAPEPTTGTNMKLTYQRVRNDFSNQIVGLWEGVSMTGDETYGDFNHRWKYNYDGTYLYYVKNGDAWEVYDQETSDYLVSGDWLTTRWRKTAKEDMNLERWDIVSCDRDSMVWSAIRTRNDGTQYSTSITFKRIDTEAENPGAVFPK